MLLRASCAVCHDLFHNDSSCQTIQNKACSNHMHLDTTVWKMQSLRHVDQCLWRWFIALLSKLLHCVWRTGLEATGPMRWEVIFSSLNESGMNDWVPDEDTLCAANCGQIGALQFYHKNRMHMTPPSTRFVSIGSINWLHLLAPWEGFWLPHETWELPDTHCVFSNSCLTQFHSLVSHSWWRTHVLFCTVAVHCQLAASHNAGIDCKCQHIKNQSSTVLHNLFLCPLLLAPKTNMFSTSRRNIMTRMVDADDMIENLEQGGRPSSPGEHAAQNL